jgi:hypothetical protein
MKRKKKESGDSSDNGICRCGLPACCSQPTIAGSVIYADLWGELSTHLVPQALFDQSYPVWEPLLQAFHFLSTGKGDTAPALSGLHVYLQFMWEVGLPPSPVQFSSQCHFHKLSCFCLLGGAAAPVGRHVYLQFTWEVGLPSSPVEFSSLHHSHRLPRSWLLGACPAPARGSLACQACFIYSPGKDSLPPIFGAPGAPPSFQCVLIILIAYYSVSLFFPRVEVSLSRGLCCSGPGLSVGVPWYHKAHLVRVFPSHLGAGHWWPRGPSSFLRLT